MEENRTKIVAVCYDRVIKSAHESHLNSGRRQPVIEQLVNFGLLDNHAKYFIRGKDKWIFMGITGAPLVERSIIDLYYISREGLTRLYRWLIFYSPRACYISSLWVERSGNSLFQLVSLKSFLPSFRCIVLCKHDALSRCIEKQQSKKQERLNVYSQNVHL